MVFPPARPDPRNHVRQIEKKGEDFLPCKGFLKPSHDRIDYRVRVAEIASNIPAGTRETERDKLRTRGKSGVRKASLIVSPSQTFSSSRIVSPSHPCERRGWSGENMVTSRRIGIRRGEIQDSPRDATIPSTRYGTSSPAGPCEPGVIYAGVSPAALFKSADGGDTWSEVESLSAHPTHDLWEPRVRRSLPPQHGARPDKCSSVCG